MQEMSIDFLVASGHKFYAPYGGGFLIGPKKFLDEFLPYQIGGGNLPYITEQGEFLRYKNQHYSFCFNRSKCYRIKIGTLCQRQYFLF